MASPFTKVVANFSTTLVTAITAGGTSATLGGNTTKEGVALPTGKYCFTVNQGKSNEQHFVCDLAGTAITNIQGVDRLGNISTGALKDAQINDEIKITDYVNLLRLVEVLTGIKNLDGGSPLAYDDTPNLANPLALATVQFVLDNINGGAVTFNAIKWAGIAGETIASGDWVYLKESDGRWYKTAANDITKCRNVRIGRAMGAGTTGNSISGGVFVEGLETVGSYVAGQKYYLSNTAGALSTTPGTENVLIGIGDANTKLLFLNVYDPEAVTYNEKQALQGNVGIPSNTNRFVTQDGMSKSDIDQTQLTQNASVEVGEANSTTRKNKIAQSFIPTRSKIRGFKLYKSADTGTFTGNVVIAIYGDSGSDTPAGLLTDVTITNAQWKAIPVGEFTATFPIEYGSLVTGTKYWIHISTSTSDTSNRPNLGINTAGGYANGSLRYNNTTDGWVTASTFDLYFKTMEGNANQGVQTDSTGAIPSDFFDVAKMPIPAYMQDIGMGDFSFSAANKSFAFGSNADGSAFYMVVNNTGGADGSLWRFERDPITGHYFQTHKVTLGTVPTSDFGSIVIIGIYGYLFSNNNTNVTCVRFLASDLSGYVGMSVPTLACSQKVIAWTDGESAYLVSGNSSTTSNKWTISGTVMSLSTTATVSSSLIADTVCSISDNTNIYLVSQTNGVVTVYKLTSIDGSSSTSVSKRLPLFSNFEAADTNNVSSLGVNIDKKRLYIGIMYQFYNATAQVAQRFVLIPISKP